MRRPARDLDSEIAAVDQLLANLNQEIERVVDRDGFVPRLLRERRAMLKFTRAEMLAIQQRRAA